MYAEIPLGKKRFLLKLLFLSMCYFHDARHLKRGKICHIGSACQNTMTDYFRPVDIPSSPCYLSQSVNNEIQKKFGDHSLLTVVSNTDSEFILIQFRSFE